MMANSMWRLRILLIPFAMVAELLLMAIILSICIISTDMALRLARWGESNFPDPDWYVGGRHHD